LELVVFAQDWFQYQRIGPEADAIRLGMSFRAIGDALGFVAVTPGRDTI